MVVEPAVSYLKKASCRDAIHRVLYPGFVEFFNKRGHKIQAIRCVVERPTTANGGFETRPVRNFFLPVGISLFLM
jgi:nucleoside diphosphate kinase